MYSRTAALVAAGVLVMSGLATGTANAAAPAVVVDRIGVANYLDNGAGGYWAWRNFTRTTTITKTAEGTNGEPDTYEVRVADRGDLRTIRGAKSPKDAVRIARSVRGSASGWYVSQVSSATEPSKTGVARFVNARCGIGDGAAPRANDCPGLPYETHDWWQLYFGDGAKPAGNASYRWDYVTACERWSDPNGTTDITGKRCDHRKEADAPTVVQPECDAAKGKLVIPPDRGVTYKVRTQGRDYRTVRAGEYDVRPGSYRVRAYAKPGVKLVGVDRWRLEVEAAEVCPTPTPTPTATDEPTATPTPDPTVEPEPTEEPTEEPEPQPTVTETETRTTTKVVVVGNVRVPGRVDTGAGGSAKNAK